MFPAHAGMIPCKGEALAISPYVPRTRGDDPGVLSFDFTALGCSPHTRG